MRYRRRRASPLSALVFSVIVLVVMTVVFAALGFQQFRREHDRSWTYQQVAFVNCAYDHSHKGTRYYDCQIGDPVTREVVYTGTTSASRSGGSGPPTTGSRWLHRGNGQVDEVGSAFPLGLEFLLLLPVAFVIGTTVSWRRSRRRRRAGYAAPAPGGFVGHGQPWPGYGPGQPHSGPPVVSDQPEFPHA